MPCANHAVGRGRHQTRREPCGPGVQHRLPRMLFELVAKELEPILGATLVAKRYAPTLVGETCDSRTTRRERVSIALKPRHHGVAASDCTQRFDCHRRMIGKAV